MCNYNIELAIDNNVKQLNNFRSTNRVLYKQSNGARLYVYHDGRMSITYNHIYEVFTRDPREAIRTFIDYGGILD